MCWSSGWPIWKAAWAHAPPAAGLPDLSGFEKAIRPNTKILYGETLGSPGIVVLPFDEIAALGKKGALPIMIDNTFATPYLRALELRDGDAIQRD